MRLKEVKGTCFVKKKKKLVVVVQMSWISSKLKLGGECKNDNEESDYTVMRYRL